MTDLPFIPYTRVSRVGKRRNDLLASHDDQIAAIRALAAREGLTLIDDLSFRDEDRSANDFNRANFVRALDLVLSGKAAGIVVATLDRFSRDVFAGAEMLKRIGERGALYADDAGGLIDLDDDESLIFYIMRGTMATLEHRRKARGLAAAVARSIRGGRHLADLYGYTRPEGFQTVTVDGESFKVRPPIERNPREAPAVLRAYEMRAGNGKRASWQTIADELNARWPLADGTQWTWSRVSSMVKSKTYKGTAHSGQHETPGAHEAIVSGDLWERANRPMPGPTPDPERDPRLLSGVLYCGSCGYRMRPTKSHGRRYYKCKRRHKVGACPAPVNLPADDAEAFMRSALAEHFASRTYHGSANGAAVSDAERTYDRQVEIVKASAPDYMARHTLPDDVREIVEATWTRANADLDRLRAALAEARSEAVGVIDWPQDLDASGIADLPDDELRTLIGAAFPVVFACRGGGRWDGVPIEDRLRPLWRSQAPAEIVAGKRLRPIRAYFVAA
jgi:DNA invertase Pin-like site-specific DNA recombinase